MWHQIRYYALGSLLFLSCSFLASCGLEQAEKNLQGIQDTTDAAGAIVPVTYKWIPAGITGLTTLALGILGMIKERRTANRMKRAIKAKAHQIDKFKVSSVTGLDAATAKITRAMKLDAINNNPKDTQSLHDFDSVRKALL